LKKRLLILFGHAGVSLRDFLFKKNFKD